MMQTFWLRQNVVWQFLVSSVHYPIFNENAVVLPFEVIIDSILLNRGNCISALVNNEKLLYPSTELRIRFVICFGP